MKKTEFIGAEAVLTVKGDVIKKNRVRKGYRINDIDEPLRSRRTKNEFRLIGKARRLGVKVPDILSSEKYEIDMEFLDGKVLRDVFDGATNYKKICENIGKSISKLHNGDIVHGDLTTSNMILKNGDIYFIDFGLSESSKKIEDKAVDLHLLKEALEAKHTKKWKIFFDEIIKNYRPDNRKAILERVEHIEKRGRYKKKD